MTEFKPQAPMELKIKHLSLAEEIRLIHYNEKRLERRRSKALQKGKESERRGILIRSLSSHREELRTEARATNLARGFLKGYSYSRIENRAYEGNTPPLERAGEIAVKFAAADARLVAQVFEQWSQEARASYEANQIPYLSDMAQKARHQRRLEAQGRQLSLTQEEREASKKNYWDKIFQAGDYGHQG